MSNLIGRGRGAFLLRRSQIVRSGGAVRSENVGISNVIQVKNLNVEFPRFPKQR